VLPRERIAHLGYGRKNPETGAITTYRRFNKPALGPLDDSLEDLK
jgi:hypothetical protein